MPFKQRLSGCDYLMLGFDYEMRRHGYAGNSCQIVLELDSAISPDRLRKRLADLLNRYPILNSRPGGLFVPTWKSTSRRAPVPTVRIHSDGPLLRQQLCNDPVRSDRAELIRFDLIELGNGRMEVIFTWAHALMDANSAEHFVAVVGREDLPLPGAESVVQKRGDTSLLKKLMLSRNNVRQLDEFCKAPPRTVGVRYPKASSALRYRLEKFSDEETARIRSVAVKHGGLFGEAQYHAVVSVMELHQLHERVGCPSPSYVLPIPVGIRPKGKVEPLFTNLVTMLMVQFLPEHLESVGKAIATLKAQTENAMRAGLVDSGLLFLETVRFMPRPVLTAFLKHGLRGEICSLFYGNTGAVSPLVTTFMGANVQDFAHVAAITPSPGIGIIFYYFRDQLRVTVLYLTKAFSDEEALGFASGLRKRLLNP